MFSFRRTLIFWLLSFFLVTQSGHAQTYRVMTERQVGCQLGQCRIETSYSTSFHIGRDQQRRAVFLAAGHAVQGVSSVFVEIDSRWNRATLLGSQYTENRDAPDVAILAVDFDGMLKGLQLAKLPPKSRESVKRLGYVDGTKYTETNATFTNALNGVGYTTGQMFPGESGGPLLNESGEAAGVNAGNTRGRDCRNYCRYTTSDWIRNWIVQRLGALPTLPGVETQPPLPVPPVIQPPATDPPPPASDGYAVILAALVKINQRLAKLEASEAKQGPPGPPGPPGAGIDPELLSALNARLSALEARKPLQGPPGLPGRDGKDADPQLIAGLLSRVSELEKLKAVPGPPGPPGIPGRDADPAELARLNAELDELKAEMAELKATKIPLEVRYSDGHVSREEFPLGSALILRFNKVDK